MPGTLFDKISAAVFLALFVGIVAAGLYLARKAREASLQTQAAWREKGYQLNASGLSVQTQKAALTREQQIASTKRALERSAQTLKAHRDAFTTGAANAVGQLAGGVGQVAGGVGQVAGGVGHVAGGVAGEVVGGVGQVAGGVMGGAGHVAGGVGQVTGKMGNVAGGVGRGIAGRFGRKSSVAQVDTDVSGGMDGVNGQQQESPSEKRSMFKRHK